MHCCFRIASIVKRKRRKFTLYALTLPILVMISAESQSTRQIAGLSILNAVFFEPNYVVLIYKEWITRSTDRHSGQRHLKENDVINHKNSQLFLPFIAASLVTRQNNTS